jgi:hypothetical protein
MWRRMLPVWEGKCMPAREEETTDATAAMIRQLAPVCSACGTTIVGHKYSEVGSAFHRSNLVEIFTAIKAREWSRIRDIHEFDPMKDVAMAFAVAGPHEGGILLAVKNPFELYETDELYMAEVLSAQEMDELTAQVSGDAWKPL